jgi:hypothetical protein
VSQALRRALVSQLHPKMLLAMFVPFLIALVAAALLMWQAWTPLKQWLMGTVLAGSYVDDVDAWLVRLGLFSVKLYLVPVLAVLILIPLAGVIGLLAASIFIMPMAVRHLEARTYLGLARRGSVVAVYGWWNAVWVLTVFVAGWLLTLPLWLIPFLPLVLPVFWWAFAVSRMLRVDSLLEHADAAERRLLWRRHNREYWMLGFVLALINVLPPAWLIMPTLSALAYAHLSLEALRQLRAQSAPPVQSVPPAPPAPAAPPPSLPPPSQGASTHV